MEWDSAWQRRVSMKDLPDNSVSGWRLSMTMAWQSEGSSWQWRVRVKALLGNGVSNWKLSLAMAGLFLLLPTKNQQLNFNVSFAVVFVGRDVMSWCDVVMWCRDVMSGGMAGVVAHSMWLGRVWLLICSIYLSDLFDTWHVTGVICSTCNLC